MNTNIKIFLLCPIPEDQKPINQYLGLKENTLTSWTTLSTTKYQQKIISLYGLFFGLISLVRFSSFQGLSYVFDWIFENLFLSTNFLLVLFFIILSRWVQIQNQFNQARFFYEETSWYDGQIWEKPFLLIKNDQLIRSQKITPIIQRIQQTIVQLGILKI
jgi:Conserved in the green lineage and diatoms 27